MDPSLFEGKFNVDHFISQVSSSVHTSQQGVFDPKPLQAQFDTLLAELSKYQDKISDDIAKCEKRYNAVSLEHQECLDTAHDQNQDVFSRYNNIFERVRDVGSSAINIGTRLDTASTQKHRAEQGIEIINYFQQFAEASPENWWSILQHITDVREQAIVVRKLENLAKEIPETLTSTAQPVLHIQQFCQEFENRILGLFEVSDSEQMREFVEVLVEFNGGASVVERYINSRHMFIDADVIQQDDRCISTATTAQSSEKVLSTLFDKLGATLEEENEIIDRVFPSPGKVMKLLVTRIFEQRIAEYVNGILANAASRSNTDFLQTLYRAYVQTLAFCERLRVYDLSDLSLQKLCDSVFDMHKQSYFPRELSCQKAALAAATPPEAAVANQARLKRPDTKNRSTTQPVPIVSDTARVREWITLNTSAVERATVLSLDDCVAENIQDLYVGLLKGVESFLIKPLQSTAEFSFEWCTQVMKHVGVSHDALKLLDEHYHSCVSVHVALSVSCTAFCEERRSVSLSAVDETLDGAVKAVLDFAVAEMDVILSDQKKTDYKPKSDAMASNKVSETCKACIQCFKRYCQLASTHLVGNSRASFVRQFGHRFYKQLLEHLRKFSISVIGGLLLMRDLTEYHECVTAYGDETLRQPFECLRALANVYLVPLEHVQDVLEQSVLRHMKYEELQQFVSLRSDAKHASFTDRFVRSAAPPHR